MSDEKREILIDVEVDTKDFDKELANINTELKKNREEIKELSKDYDANAKEIAKLERANIQLSNSKREVIKQSETEGNSINSLRLKLANLTKERNNLDTSIEGNAERFAELQKEIKNTNDQLKGFEEAGGDFRRNVGNYKSAFDGFKTSINAVGLAFKALGIGLIIAALNKLREIIGANQKVMDFFNTALRVVNMALTDLVNFVVDNLGTVADLFGKAFSDPRESIAQLGTLLRDFLIKRVELTIETFSLLGKTIEAVFEGNFKKAYTTAEQAGSKFVDSLVGVDDAIAKTKQFFVDTGESIKNYATDLVETAAAFTDLENKIKVNESLQQITQLRLERQAELQRQIVADTSLDFETRIAASKELGAILDRQAKTELALVQARKQLAAGELSQNNNIDNQVAYNNALAAELEILNRIESQRSAQLTEQTGLIREARTEQLQIDQEYYNQLEAIRSGFEERGKINLQESIAQSIQAGAQIQKQRENDLAKAKAIEDARVAYNKQAQQDLTNAIIAFAGQQSKVGKALALSQVVSDTARGITGAIAAGAGVPFPGNLAAIASGVAAVLSGVAQAKTILGAGSDVGGGALSTAAADISTPTDVPIIQPNLVSQFSQPIQQNSDLIRNNNTSPVVSVVDIIKGINARNVNVNESRL